MPRALLCLAWSVASLVLGLAGMTLVAAPAQALDLVSHRAAYRLSLVGSGNDGGLTAVRGGLVMEWRAECDGWISNQRLGFAAATEEGPGFTYDVRLSSWESRDNTKLSFTIKTYDDGQLGDELEGKASLHGPDASGEAVYSEPADQKLDLPAGTVFPTEHIRRLIAAAQSGEHIVNHPVFDGSSSDTLTQVTTVIGKPRQSADGKRWPLHLAYYGVTQSDTTPDFEITFDMDEGGIVYDLTLDYGDYALKAELEKLEKLPTPDCP